MQLQIEERILDDEDEWEDPLHSFLKAKYSCDDPAIRAQILQLAQADVGNLELDAFTLLQASFRIRKKNKVDQYGVSPLVIHLAIAQCLQAPAWFSSLLLSPAFFSNSMVPCWVFSKVQGTTPISKTRILFPLPSLLQLADVVLSMSLNKYLDTKFANTLTKPVYQGAVRFSQPLDISSHRE